MFIWMNISCLSFLYVRIECSVRFTNKLDVFQVLIFKREKIYRIMYIRINCNIICTRSRRSTRINTMSLTFHQILMIMYINCTHKKGTWRQGSLTSTVESWNRIKQKKTSNNFNKNFKIFWKRHKIWFKSI